MTRVLHCVSSLAVGGVETRVLNMFRYFARHAPRHQHCLCAFRGGRLAETHLPAVTEAGFKCEILNRPARFSLAFCRGLRRSVRALCPDVIHAYNPTAALWTRLLLGKHRDRRIVVHCGGVGGLNRLWRTIERSLLSRTDAFVFNSHATRAIWERFVPIACDRRVIYNGLALDDSARSPLTKGGFTGVISSDDVSPGRPTHPTSSSPFVLLTVCRVVPVKALHTQLDAVRILHDRGQSDIRLIIVGDGPILSQLKDRAHHLDIANAVAFEGYQSDPRAYHSRAHVYLSTSYHETFNMSLAAAMFDRMICIAARAGGPAEIIEDARSGYLLPCTEPLPREHRGKLPTGQALPALAYDHTTGRLAPIRGLDPQTLADRIAEVRSRFDQLDSMRDAAHRRIAEHFDIATYCHALEQLYDQLAERGAHARR